MTLNCTGFSDAPREVHGTYFHSYSWFDILFQFNSEPWQPGIQHRFQDNVHAGQEYKTHVNTFDITRDRLQGDTLWRLSAGDIIRICPRAFFAGWVNDVSKVTVEVVGLEVIDQGTKVEEVSI
jgi:hypothetical protein